LQVAQSGTDGVPPHCVIPADWGKHPGQLQPIPRHCWHVVYVVLPVQEPTEASTAPLLLPIPLLPPMPLLLVPKPLLEPKPLLPPLLLLLLPLDPPVKPGSAAL
jgi:hypothetical protein